MIVENYDEYNNCISHENCYGCGMSYMCFSKVPNYGCDEIIEFENREIE